MLIPSGFAKLPNKESCYNNQIVFGGTVGQLASSLAQLSNCKFLGEAHYHIGQQILPGIGGMIDFGYGNKRHHKSKLHIQLPISKFTVI